MEGGVRSGGGGLELLIERVLSNESEWIVLNMICYGRREKEV